MQTRRMMILPIALVILLIAATCPAVFAGEEDPSLDKVATINETVISRADLDKEASRLRQQYQLMRRPADDMHSADIDKEALERLIARELLYQETQKQGLQVDDEEITKHVETIRSRFGSEEEFQSRIAEANLSEEDLRDDFKRGKAIQDLIEQEVISKIAVSEEEIRSFYDDNPQLFNQSEQVKASHILIKADPTADEAAKAKAREELVKIKQKLAEGGDFTELAKEFSQGPSAPRGGDLGFFGRGRMVKPFDDTAFALEAGEISDIVETRFGYHLIKVFDKRAAAPVPYDTAKVRIEQSLKQRKIGEETGLYIDKLREAAGVETFLPEKPDLSDQAQQPEGSGQKDQADQTDQPKQAEGSEGSEQK